MNAATEISLGAGMPVGQILLYILLKLILIAGVAAGAWILGGMIIAEVERWLEKIVARVVREELNRVERDRVRMEIPISRSSRG